MGVAGGGTGASRAGRKKSFLGELGLDWAQLRRDIWDEPTIRSVGAVLLTALVTLIVWLTIEFSHLSVDRSGVITPYWGYVTIGFVLAFTIVAAFEPMVMRHVGQWIWSKARYWFYRQHEAAQAILALLGCAAFALAKIPSVAWSLTDYLLARPAAVIAGTTLRGILLRYVWFVMLMAATIGVALAASMQKLPAEWGLWSLAAALVLILGVVRRWTWFEADRDTYLIERGGTREDNRNQRSAQEERQRRQLQCLLAASCAAWLVGGAVVVWPAVASAPAPLPTIALALAAFLGLFFLALFAMALWGRAPRLGEDALRVGFTEDLRDEALAALVFLFALVPLTLDLIYWQSSPRAFEAEANYAIPEELGPRLLLWLGFFGAELAKTVPFVDWSEVFHVANKAPIHPADGAGATPLGAQVVFVMRAGLDLLLLATVVQAITMVSRLREQNIAFANNQLPILEPFSEARELERANEGIRDELDIPPAEQHAVAAFPNYDAKRLRELISEEDETPTRLVDTRDDVRRAAVALLAAKHKGGATDAYLFRRALEAPGDSLRKWILDVASGLAPERDALKHPEDRDKLIGLLSDRVNRRIVAAPVRAAAARRLGRIGGGEDLALVLLERLADGGEDVEVRADAAVAIAKVDITENLRARAVENATALAATFSGPLIGEPLLPAMATAHALARLNPQTRAADVAKLFHEPLRKHAERAALIQVDDWKPAEAVKQAAVGDRMDQLVRIEPGEFNLGCDYDESRSDEGLREDQSPQTRVRIARAFALGRFPVTNREYRGYCDAMGLRGVNEDVGAIDAGKSKRPQVVDKDRFADFPVVQVSWYDANAYAGWLERITGERYRLPTEAEWEYACRAGTETPYWWGEFYGEDGKVDLFNISPVNLEGTGPNPWGLWSLYGHVYEWCADPWHPNYKGHPGTGEVWLEKCDPNKRVVRGGSFNWPRPGPEDANARRNELRSTYRNEQVPGHIQTNYGFRIARSLSK